MNTILVWILVTVGGKGMDQVVYSPPMVDLESCQRPQASVESLPPKNNWHYQVYSRCVQVRTQK